jgi:hypothetical protein
MRRKTKPPPAPSAGNNNKKAEEIKLPQNETSDQADVAKPQPRLPPPARIPITPKNEKGLFGGFFGKKSKKELELEEAKRRQEELIKEQLRAMQMDDELKAMEEEKEKQEILVQEAIESRSKADVSVSSWETDTSYEESDQASEEELSLEASSSDDSSSDSSCLSESDSVSRDGEVVAKEEIKSDFSAESAEMWSEAGLSTPLQDARSKDSEKRIEDKTASVSRASASRASSMLTSSDGADKLGSDDRPNFALPPKQITTSTREKSASTPEPDAVSVVSDDSFDETDEAFAKTPDSENLAQPRRRVRPPQDRSKSSTLSAHLRKQKREQKKREKRMQVTRYGDEISLGSVGLKGKISEEKVAEHPPSSPTSPNFERNQPGPGWIQLLGGRFGLA